MADDLNSAEAWHQRLSAGLARALNGSAAASSIPRRGPSLPADPTHPVQVALRTYALSLSLSLGPALIPFVTALLSPAAKRKNSASFTALLRLLRCELRPDGFAFAITVAVAGGAGIRSAMERWTSTEKGSDERDPGTVDLNDPNGLGRALDTIKDGLRQLSKEQQGFLSNVISSYMGVLLLQAGRNRTESAKAAQRGTPWSSRHPSPTLDLTLLLIVRAVDSVVQAFVIQRSSSAASPTSSPSHLHPHQRTLQVPLVQEKLEAERINRENKLRQQLTSSIDGFVFWACSARIMWCYFYEPYRLSRSYVKWINALANLDLRIIQVLQRVRSGEWVYGQNSPNYGHLLQETAEGLGYSRRWGDPFELPGLGGRVADKAWQSLGLTTRAGVGGIPCEVIHGQIGSSVGLSSSCTANALIRTFNGWKAAIAIYLPVHFLPTLLTRPTVLLRPHRVLGLLFGSLRSAAFLSSFLGIYWYTVCLTRTLVLARLFPFISHNFWDGPYGCVMAGCLACGGSIWLENGKRRGEMSLYVLPRAVRACLPERWIKQGGPRTRFFESIAFVLSLATLLTSASHRPDSLRGLSRWALAFVINGPNAGFWKKRRKDPSAPPTPGIAVTPAVDCGDDEALQDGLVDQTDCSKLTGT